jgi:hypothetical protein
VPSAKRRTHLLQEPGELKLTLRLEYSFKYNDMFAKYTIHMYTISKLNSIDKGRGMRWRLHKCYPRIWLPGSAGCQPTPALGARTVV